MQLRKYLIDAKCNLEYNLMNAKCNGELIYLKGYHARVFCVESGENIMGVGTCVGWKKISKLNKNSI